MIKFGSIIFVFALVTSMVSYAETSPVSIQPGTSFDELYGLLSKPPIEDFNSIEDFMGLFNPEKSWFAPLMITSRSLQGGYRTDPRAVFISPPAGKAQENQPFKELNFISEILLFSVNGRSDQRNGDNIEIIHYDSKLPLGEQLNFFDFDFDLPIGQRMSKANPGKCKKCHGSNPRLIHDPIGRWPGMLNSRTSQGLSNEGDVEGWRESNNHPRFANISFRNSSFSANTRLNEAIRIPNAHRIVNFILKSPDYEKYKYAIVGALAACDDFDQFLPNDIVDRHQNIDRIEYLSSESREIMDSRGNLSHSTLLDLYKEDTILRDKDFVSRFDILNSNFVVPSLYNLRWIFESRGLGIAHWFSGVQEGYYQSSQNFIKLGTLKTLMKFDNEISDIASLPALDDLRRNQNNEVEQHQQVCNDLKTKSLNALNSGRLDSEVRPQLVKMKDIELPLDHFTNQSAGEKSCLKCHSGFRAGYSGPKFVRKDYTYPVEAMICAHCHSDPTEDRVGPYIPFNNQDEMDQFLNDEPSMTFVIAARLSEDAYLDLSHMPPVFLLPEKDRVKLLNFFDFYKDEEYRPKTPIETNSITPFGNL